MIRTKSINNPPHSRPTRLKDAVCAVLLLNYTPRISEQPNDVNNRYGINNISSVPNNRLFIKIFQTKSDIL